jgi:hypothetical protein
MAALSVRSIEAIKPRERPFTVSIDRGLQLRVAPDGRRTLLVHYTVKGSRDEHQYSLPHDYGEGPGHIKLADARARSRPHSSAGAQRHRLAEQEAARLRAALQEKFAVETPQLTFAEALREYAERKRQENSGFIEITSVLGRGDGRRYYLGDMQAHDTITGEFVEGGQLWVLSSPVPKNRPASR